ncbi:putative GMC oxidoreductase [Xylaria intraflava]|nr:putative GMC oxidoreductase [Xylaria intraflava]
MWPFQDPYPLRTIEDISKHEYDYIVVGGGTAGCAVASRLSQDPDVTVLLLDRGGLADRWITRVPLASVANGSYMVRKPTEPHVATGNRAGEIWTAEALGGNSRMNAMIYTRGVPAYYDRWAGLGYPNWSWAQVERYFTKVEDALGNETPSGATIRDSRVGVHVTQSHPISGVYPYLQGSAQALGLRVESAPNNPDAPATGYFNLDLTIDATGYRHSAERAYLPYDIVLERKTSLHICTDAVVSRLDFSGSEDVVSGVFVGSVSPGSSEEVRIRAKREVILCAGAICTPQILQLSGIGPEALLRDHEISVRRALSGVGGYLSDHSAFPVFINVPSHDTLHQIAASRLQALKQFLQFVFFRSGWLKSSVDRAIFLNSAHVDTNEFTAYDMESAVDGSEIENIPDVEIMVVPVNTRPDLYPDASSITLQTCLYQPFSTGTVQIRSKNPTAHPLICLQTLSDPRDRVVARTALRFSLRLAEHFVNQSGYPYPCSVFEGPGDGRSWNELPDDQLDEYIEKHISSIYHLTSSCRMGPEDVGGVVDGELRVHGFRNLRVADASVLPNIPAAHPMAAVYMVAERCADFVKNTWDRT